MILIAVFRVDKDTPEETFEFYVKTERYIEVLIVLLMTDRLLSFLELNDNTSPLMDIIVQIFDDIGYFMFVFIIVIVSSAICFYLFG